MYIKSGNTNATSMSNFSSGYRILSGSIQWTLIYFDGIDWAEGIYSGSTLTANYSIRYVSAKAEMRFLHCENKNQRNLFSNSTRRVNQIQNVGGVLCVIWKARCLRKRRIFVAGQNLLFHISNVAVKNTRSFLFWMPNGLSRWNI